MLFYKIERPTEATFTKIPDGAVIYIDNLILVDRIKALIVKHRYIFDNRGTVLIKEELIIKINLVEG